MLRKHFDRTRTDESGFTLIELLVVILIIGVLAAIALPAFLSQRAKSQDASAKTDARNLVTHIESCYVTTGDYQLCEEGDAAFYSEGLDLARSTVTSTGPNSFEVTANSDSGNTFTIAKVGGGASTRTCSDAGAIRGGCDGGSW